MVKARVYLLAFAALCLVAHIAHASECSGLEHARQLCESDAAANLHDASAVIETTCDLIVQSGSLGSANSYGVFRTTFHPNYNPGYHDARYYDWVCNEAACPAGGHPSAPQLRGTFEPGHIYCYESCEGTYAARPGGGVDSVCVGAECRSFGSMSYTGNSCSARPGVQQGDGTGPCDASTGICYDDDGPKFCTQGREACVPMNPSDQCGTGGGKAICQGQPNPPPPPDPPIQHQPDYNPNPPPPDGISHITVNNTTNITVHNYNGGSGTPPPGPGQGGGDPPNSGRCGTAGNPPCPAPTPCGQPGKPCDSGGGGIPGNGCGGQGQPVCDDTGHPACGAPGKPACSGDGTPSCGVAGRPPCGSDGGPTCGVQGKPQCAGDGTGPVCGIPGKPDCQGGNTGSCGGPGQPPCSSCGGQGQPPCTQCGGDGQPACPDASGGGDCNTPPVCSGDAVGCAILYQTWQDRCAAGTGRSGVTGTLWDAPADGPTFASIAGKLRDGLSSSELGSAISGFFTLNASGSCPSLPIPQSDVWRGLDPDILCQPGFLTILDLAAYVLLAAAAFSAVRIAIY